ncbi:methyltransferase domain-containing protein [Anaerocolumna sedimenticola]|uniref:Methyltransferase domain-containing protein n=1 Tax=Anaerocolumna sedimenticola TaxID=2696063 RepID=A0A6P1TR59_9FIRM|nr:methyltransferase domain-containing protein [Anaerocolumna sedimenticola]QHQ62963.1 methyltransferase domain-containing protein [Anaerocolumna sedimenticola]
MEEKKKIPFWEESYKNDDISAFGANPNPEVKEFIDIFDKNGKVLEAGCGEAKNAFYLIENGFRNVSAFDLSDNAIKKVHKIAEKRKIHINAFVQDLCRYQWDNNFDLVISYGTLHFVKSEEWHKFIFDAKEHTNSGGFHVIQIFTDKVPASEDIKEFAVGLSKEGELLTLYQDWKIIDHKEFILEDEHAGVPKHYHAINKIVARKK